MGEDVKPRRAEPLEQAIIATAAGAHIRLAEEMPMPPEFILRGLTNALLVMLVRATENEANAVHLLDTLFREMRLNFADVHDKIRELEKAKK